MSTKSILAEQPEVQEDDLQGIFTLDADQFRKREQLPNVHKLNVEQKLRLNFTFRQSLDPRGVGFFFNREPTETEISALEEIMRQMVNDPDIIDAIVETNEAAKTEGRVAKCKCESAHFNATEGHWTCNTCGRRTDE